jgi:hypothetical protein
MDWLEELAVQEAVLREHLAQLAKRAEVPGLPAAPGDFDRAVRPTVEAMQAALDDYLCGRSTEELSWMSYEVRLMLPLFSHLRYLLGLVSEAEAEPAA